MDQINHAERAAALFKEGYNCAQSVFAAYHEELGLDQATALKLASSFGGGMGRLREVCGALTGLFMVAGMKYGYADPQDLAAKKAHYQRIQDLARQFRTEYGSILCRDIIPPESASTDPTPEPRTDAYYRQRSCADYVRYAAGLLDEYQE